MKITRLVTGLFAIGLTLTFFWLLAGPSESPEVLDLQIQVALGKRAYNQNCISCHGNKGRGENPEFAQGGDNTTGANWAPALNGTGQSWLLPPEIFKDIVTNGSTIKNSQMIGFADRLSEKEIDGVIAYVQSLWPEEIRQKYKQMHGKKTELKVNGLE